MSTFALALLASQYVKTLDFSSVLLIPQVKLPTPQIHFPAMGNIFSMATPILDTDMNITMYILSYLLFIGVVLGVVIAIHSGSNMYINHRRSTRHSSALLDEEKDLPEEKDEKAALLPSQRQSRQEQNRQPSTDRQSCTYGNERFSILSSNYGATNPLRVLDKRSKSKNTINKPVSCLQRSATEATAHVPKYFTKYGMTEAV